MGREDVACYRLYAANCVELAQHTEDADRRLFLLRMAQAWTKLASQVEAYADSETRGLSPAHSDQLQSK